MKEKIEGMLEELKVIDRYGTIDLVHFNNRLDNVISRVSPRCLSGMDEDLEAWESVKSKVNEMNHRLAARELNCALDKAFSDKFSQAVKHQSQIGVDVLKVLEHRV